MDKETALCQRRKLLCYAIPEERLNHWRFFYAMFSMRIRTGRRQCVLH
jgi:hypothetical protein